LGHGHFIGKSAYNEKCVAYESNGLVALNIGAERGAMKFEKKMLEQGVADA